MENDKNKNLVWIDLEMTGLDEEKHVIIEIASLVTDSNLEELAIGPTIAIKRTSKELSKIEDYRFINGFTYLLFYKEWLQLV